MMISSDRASARRVVRLAVAGLAVLGAVQGAAASDDGGVHQFFSAIFGGGAEQAAVPTALAQPRDVARTPAHASRGRPLTVWLHRDRAKPRVAVAQVPTKPAKVSIFEDRTLRRGDAVMMADGIRIFSGSQAWPYRAEDFVSLSSAKDLSQGTTKVLAEVNRLPRG